MLCTTKKSDKNIYQLDDINLTNHPYQKNGTGNLKWQSGKWRTKQFVFRKTD